jgi:geranylgeranyl reductase family protein
MSMPNAEGWDVLVVGAGPAGSAAGIAAASEGARVLVVDRRETIGSPVQCAEFLPRQVVLDLKLPSEAIAQDVERTRTFLMGEEASVRRNPGCILNRDVADTILARRAVDAGAELWKYTRVIDIELRSEGRHAVSVYRPDGPSVLHASVVIGADGPRSTVGESLGVVNDTMVVAHQVTAPLSEPLDDTEVYLDPTFPGGYAWLFPKGDRANVGVGVDASMGASPKAAMSTFMNALGDRIGEPMRSTGGLIPVGGVLPMMKDRVLLAGDAAGHTHPITGGGIHQATVAGRLAGEAAAAFAAGDEGALEAYEPAFLDLFGLHLGRALERRRELLVAWPRAMDDPGTFARLARRGWIGFKEFYRDGGGGSGE